MKVLRFLFFSAIAVAVIAGVGLAGMIVGYRALDRNHFPHTILAKFNWKLDEIKASLTSAETPTVDGPDAIPSHLLLLDLERQFIDTGEIWTVEDPVARNGGGLTSFGDELLLLPYSGRLFAIQGSEPAQPTEVYAPDNNRDAYIATTKDPAYADYRFFEGFLRYNDITYFDTGAARGLLVAYTHFYSDDACYGNVVARLDIDRSVTSIHEVNAPSDAWEIIYRSEPCLPLKEEFLALEGHLAGGKLAFEAPSTVYMTAGDYHFDGMRARSYPIMAQEPEAEYGKIISIDIDSGDAEIVSMGHRNPQGISILPDGRVYIAEHGPRGGDELNLIEEGKNYGWPLASYGTSYKGMNKLPPALAFARHDGFEEPKYAWLPSVAISDLVYVDNFHPAWDGDLLAGSLIDLSLHRIRLSGEYGIYSERIEVGERLRDIHIHTDGRLALWVDSNQLLFLSPRTYTESDQIMVSFVNENALDDATASRLSAEIESCAECHSFQEGDHEKAPSLARIFGSEIGSTSYALYSDGLRQNGGTWTKENMIAFLRDPNGFAPGTTMPNPGLEDEEMLSHLAEYLKSLASTF